MGTEEKFPLADIVASLSFYGQLFINVPTSDTTLKSTLCNNFLEILKQGISGELEACQATANLWGSLNYLNPA